MPPGIKVLITGASGRVGRAFRKAYKHYYSLRLVYHRSLIKASASEEVVPARI